MFSDNTVVFRPWFSPVHATLKSTFSSLVAERDRLRHTIDLHAPQPGQVMGLKTAYASVSVSMTQKSLFRMITPQIPLSPQVQFYKNDFLCSSGMSRRLSLIGPPGVQWEQSIYPRVHIRVFRCSGVPAVVILLWEWGERLWTTFLIIHHVTCHIRNKVFIAHKT